MKKVLLIRRVVGGSMLPRLVPGRIVVAHGWGAVSTGDVIILVHDGLEKIKRVSRIEGGKAYVLGDNAEASTDSREFGWVNLHDIIAKVIWPRL